jgi:hypothetical protein
VMMGEMFATFKELYYLHLSRPINQKIKYVGEFDPHYRGTKILRNDVYRRRTETG